MGDQADTGRRYLTLHPDCPRWLAEAVISAISGNGAAGHVEIATNGRTQTVLERT